MELDKFDELRGQIAAFVKPVQEMIVSDVASNAVATGSLKTVKQMLTEIESRRTEVTGPLRDKISQVNLYAKEIAGPLLQAETQIKQKIGTWANAERVRIETERRELEEQRLAEQRRLDEARREREAEIAAKAEAERKALEEKASAEAAEAKKKQDAESEARKAFGASVANAERIAADESARLARRIAEEQRAAEARAAEASEALRVEQERASKEQELAAHRAARAAEAARPKNLRRVVKFEVVDLSLIPREHMVVNEASIRKALQAVPPENVPTFSIPGVKWRIEFEVVAR